MVNREINSSNSCSSVPHGCPCGYATDPKRQCKCSSLQVDRYLAKISGPLVDRIDIHIDVPAVPFNALQSDTVGTSSAQMREQVLNARDAQRKRYGHNSITSNANMSSRQVREFCKLDEKGQAVIKNAVYEMGLSARAHDKLLKISRTIADMENSDAICAEHLQEAIQYRRLDRQY